MLPLLLLTHPSVGWNRDVASLKGIYALELPAFSSLTGIQDVDSHQQIALTQHRLSSLILLAPPFRWEHLIAYQQGSSTKNAVWEHLSWMALSFIVQQHPAQQRLLHPGLSCKWDSTHFGSSLWTTPCASARKGIASLQFRCCLLWQDRNVSWVPRIWLAPELWEQTERRGLFSDESCF